MRMIALRQVRDLSRHGDLLLAALVVGIVAMMIIPLPTFLLDILITTNISIAVLLLLVSIYVSDALRVAAFPSILLITTLFRLGLNVSSTRLILIQADAGSVIRSFGEFVVAGNLVVGAVIFLILTLIQFIVIAKGSERVAEVAARFTLDAMPGKQMAIDADVRAGAIDLAQARSLRRQLQREAQLYGSMDGAMKFVKGDAIAGILITAINIVGGLLIGVFQRGMDAGEAAQLYSILTIGDGLVSQIPALLISTAAGIVVTRVASEDEGAHLGRDIGAQILAQPKAVAISSALLALLALVPGLPTLPFLVISALLGALAYRLRRRALASPELRANVSRRTRPGAADHGSAQEMTAPEAIALELGQSLMARVEGGSEGKRLLDQLVPGLREMLLADLGVIIPGVNVRLAAQVPPEGYRILLAEVPFAEGRILPEGVIALIEASQARAFGVQPAEPVKLPGVAAATTVVPLEAMATLERRGIQILDAPTQIVLHLGQVLREHAAELIGIQETQHLLDQLERTHPALVNEVVPKLVSVQQLSDVLRRLVEEGISVRDLRRILETLAEWGGGERDTVVLAEHARVGLRRQISHRYAGAEGRLRAFVLDPAIEETVRGAIQRTSQGSYLALEPELARDVVESVRRHVERVAGGMQVPPLVTSMDVRRYVRRLLEVDFPALPVLSFNELVPTVQVEPLSRIVLAG